MGSTVDISELVKTDLSVPLDPDIVAQVLSKPPFVDVAGAINIRDVGAIDGSTVRSGFLFRSGMLALLTDEGKLALTNKLGVKHVFDLRLAGEREKTPNPTIEGLQDHWLEVAEQPSALVISDFAGEDGGEDAMLRMYKNILVTHVPIFRAVFECIRDYPDEPILFHCAGGKDRTGILAALILQIGGCDPVAIANDYTLTRIGGEPMRKLLEASNAKDGDSSPTYRKGINGLHSARYQTMVRFLDHLVEAYDGGSEGYVTSVLGYSPEDLLKIRANIKCEGRD